MAKVGRNHPCACGSGKKYKHCCLAHDAATAPTAHADLAPVSEGPAPPPMALADDRFEDDDIDDIDDAFFEDGDDEDDAEDLRLAESNEDSHWKQFWRDLNEAEPEEKARIVNRMIEVTDDLDGDLAFDLVVAVIGPLQRAGRADDVERLIQRIEELHPEAYQDQLGWMRSFRARNALERPECDIGPPLALLAGHPERVDEFSRLADALMYHGRVQELTTVMVAALPQLVESGKLGHTHSLELREIAFSLVLDKHLARDPQLCWDDPEFLQEATRILARNDEWLQRLVAHSSGRASRVWQPADLQGALSKRVFEHLVLLSVDFSRALHVRWGWPRSRAELARRTLMEHLTERARPRSSGAKLLLPLSPNAADEFLASCFRLDKPVPHRAAAFHQALLPWMKFLCDMRLVDPDTLPRFVRSMQAVTSHLLILLDQHVYDPLVLELTQGACAETP